MGESFLTNTQKKSLSDVMFDIHATFARDIIIFKTSQRVVVSTNPDHNFLFDNAPTNDVVENVIQSGVFQARILYAKKEPLGLFHGTYAAEGTQNNIKKEEGDVRIKIDATGAAYLFDAQRITFDNTVYENITSPRPHGLFTPDFYTFYLKKLN